MSEFKVGDRVVTTEASRAYEKGERGVVLQVANLLHCRYVDFGDRKRHVHASRLAHVEEAELSEHAPSVLMDVAKNYHVSIAADGLDVLCDKATNDQVSRIIEILLEES